MSPREPCVPPRPPGFDAASTPRGVGQRLVFSPATAATAYDPAGMRPLPGTSDIGTPPPPIPRAQLCHDRQPHITRLEKFKLCGNEFMLSP